jgi:hypothetical protein
LIDASSSIRFSLNSSISLSDPVAPHGDSGANAVMLAEGNRAQQSQ